MMTTIKSSRKVTVLLLISALFLLLFQHQSFAQNDGTIAFKEAFKDFPREEKNIRKWDAPVIADLDQDGFVDLLINDHGYGVRVCWNNNGRFAKPFDILIGDIHGVTVGDFDFDGNLEIVMSRGGGSGDNARNAKIFSVDKQRNFTALPDFNEPLALMRGRTVAFMDGDNDGDLDLINFAFPDKNKKGESENYIYTNDGQGQLKLFFQLPAIKSDGQKTLITDFDGDGVLDILLYGHGTVKAFQGQGNLTFKDVSKKVIPEIERVSCIVEIDYDNDGDFDLYLTRGKGFEKGETFYDKETKTFGFYTRRGEFRFEDLEAGDILKIENYQSQWPVNDALFLGETGYDYEFSGETHSGKDIRLVNSDALGFPDKLTQKGAYVGYVGNRKWRLSGNIWSPATGIIHGVESYPKYDHPKGLNDILLENRKGKFTEVTRDANLVLEEHTTQAAVADFNNDGWKDIIVVKRGDLIHENKSLIYMNNGNNGFIVLKDHQVVSPELGAIGMAVETMDYNKDGLIDIVIGNERGKWHLYKNNNKQADNNFIIIEVGNSPSGRSTGLGAFITVESCNNIQTMRVGSTGAAYSLSFNSFLHFGLGSCKDPVKVTVKWSNGETLEKSINEINSTFLIGKKD